MENILCRRHMIGRSGRTVSSEYSSRSLLLDSKQSHWDGSVWKGACSAHLSPVSPQVHRKVCGKGLLTVPWASHANTNMHTSHTSHTHKKDLFYFVCICVWVCPCECGWPHRPEVSETPGTGVISTCKPADVGAGNWTLKLFSGRAVHALHFRAISSAHKVTFLPIK